MSKKTLIAIICITIITIMSGSVVVYSQSDIYGYEVVNSTNDEINKNTIEKSYYENLENANTSYNENTGTLLNEAKNNVNKYLVEINKIVDVTNQYRSEVNQKNLKFDKNLSIAATVRALEMAYTNKLSHTRPDGAYCFKVLGDLGIKYNYAGENIGDGFKQPEDVCEAWKDSPSHYKNIVNSKYNKIGIGVAQGPGGRLYWVQIFSN